MASLPHLAVVLAFRLGLGWLVGRRRLILTTGAPGSDDGPRAVLPYRFDGGVLSVATAEGSAWGAELERRPVAMAQAAPGPLAVAASLHGDVIEMTPTGRPAPLPVVPDLVWLWAAALVVALLVGRRRGHRGGRPSSRRA